MQNSKEIRTHKRRLKHNMTPSEKEFARLLNKNGFQPFKVQMILGYYILDFCLPDRMLNIEIDGNSHDNKQGKDRWRDGFVRKCGFEVIRIKNEEVGTYDFNQLYAYPTKMEAVFRSGLAKANALMSKAKQKLNQSQNGLLQDKN